MIYDVQMHSDYYKNPVSQSWRAFGVAVSIC